ncbi:hypothetical protein OQA88_6409 [Cercophora sp. LCS_1]
MSVVFEHRAYMQHDDSYPPMDHQDPINDSVVADLATVATFNAPVTFVESPEPQLNLAAEVLPPSSLPVKEDSPTAITPTRIKPIPKPDREVTKNGDGKFVCTFPECTEEVKEFGRKCEWNKHMDKHDRPYKCAADGCEKLPGFTYAGGLLRHEREVHGKHGGPKQSFHCPHLNCKRHGGKGFSRAENLNEHLRRVHTQNGGQNGVVEAETDDAGSEIAAGQKRKREDDDSGSDPREENKRLRQQIKEFQSQVDALTQQTSRLVQRIRDLEKAQQDSQAALGVSPGV